MSIHRLICLALATALLTTAASLHAQPSGDPPTGTNLLGENEAATLKLMSAGGYWGRGKVVDVTGQPFAQAYQVSAAQKPGKPSNVQFQVKYQKPINKGDVIFVQFYARAVDAEKAHMDMIAGPGSRKMLEFGPEWVQVTDRFVAKDSWPAEDKNTRLMAFIGQEKQTMQIGGMVALNLGPDVDIKTIPQDIPKPEVQLLRSGTEYTVPTPEAITGAVVDEGKVRSTIHLSLKGSDEADGSDGAPVQTFRHALALANAELKAGRGVRILLQAGVYREGFTDKDGRDDFSVDGKQLGEAGADAPLVIEAADGAQVVFDGSDPFPIAQWKKAGESADGDPIYQRKLEVDLGWDRKHFNATNPRKPIGYRMDSAFINDTPLRQLMLEDYPDVDTKKGGAMYKNDAYVGPLDPQKTLTAGTYGVQVHDPENKSIFICPPKGMDLTTANVAVGARGEALRLISKNNVVVRGITFQRYGTNLGSAPVFFIGAGNKMSHNFMVENCKFLWNNGSGIRFVSIEGLTLRNCVSNYNSFRGENGQAMRNILFENNQANFNNWRGVWGGFRGWAVAGSKSVHVRDMMVRNCQIIGNMAYGFWLDVDCQNINVDGLLAAYNTSAGFYFEISDGPCLVENSILAYNGAGAVFQGSDQIEMRNSILVGNGKQIRMTHEKENGRPHPGSNTLDAVYGTTTLPKSTRALGRVNIHDNLLVATNPNTQFVAVQFQEDFPKRRAQFLGEWLKMDQNIYVNVDEPSLFGMNDLRHVYGKELLAERDKQATLEQWQTQAKQDQKSKTISGEQAKLAWVNEIPRSDAFAVDPAKLPAGITAEKKAEAEAFFRFVGVPLESLTVQNVYQAEFQAE